MLKQSNYLGQIGDEMSISESFKQLGGNPIVEKLKKLGPFWGLLSDESDRQASIVSACILDDLLERIVTASFIRDKAVKRTFEDDHILQSFYAKINISYYSGLIQKTIYNDLKLICRIRNKFAHSVITDLDFTDSSIAQQIGEFSFPTEFIEIFSEPRVRFRVVVLVIVAVLLFTEEILTRNPVQHFVDTLNATKEAGFSETDK